jgi:hypothetical protein
MGALVRVRVRFRDLKVWECEEKSQRNKLSGRSFGAPGRIATIQGYQ